MSSSPIIAASLSFFAVVMLTTVCVGTWSYVENFESTNNNTSSLNTNDTQHTSLPVTQADDDYLILPPSMYRRRAHPTVDLGKHVCQSQSCGRWKSGPSHNISTNEQVTNNWTHWNDPEDNNTAVPQDLGHTIYLPIYPTSQAHKITNKNIVTDVEPPSASPPLPTSTRVNFFWTNH